MSPLRALRWLAFVVLLELVTRALVYGMAPSADASARELGGRLGGPGFVVVLLVALGLAAALSVGLVWLASLGVRERWALAEDRPSGPPPTIAAWAVIARAVILTLVGWLTFAAIETAIHVHEGLGFHGLECLVGPVHRNALPIVAALALVASALAAVARLVLAWMRRTVGRFARPRAAGRPGLAHHATASSLIALRSRLITGAPPRGPPLSVV